MQSDDVRHGCRVRVPMGYVGTLIRVDGPVAVVRFDSGTVARCWLNELEIFRS